MSQPVNSPAATPPDRGDPADGPSRPQPDADPQAQAAPSRQRQMAGAQDLRDRLGIALALDDPSILQADVAQLNSRVAQALSRLRAESEDLALQSRELSQTLRALTAERDGLLTGLARSRAEQDRMRDDLTSARKAALAERDRALTERDRAMAERDKAAAELTESRDLAAQREAAMVASTSWRVTAPLRAISRATGRLGQSPGGGRSA